MNQRTKEDREFLSTWFAVSDLGDLLFQLGMTNVELTNGDVVEFIQRRWYGQVL